MKKIIQQFHAKGLAWIILAVTLFSFSTKPGGDSFQIYVNDKLVLQQFVLRQPGVQNILLDPSNNNDQLSVRYDHCGIVGHAKNLIIRDEKNNILKEWKFADDEKTMVCRIKDITDLRSDGIKSLSLFYSSSELPKGRVLASISLNDVKASVN